MKHAMTRKLAAFMAGLMLVLAGQAGAKPRDDTEIYFNAAKPSKASRPNALFILDTSASMLFPVSSEAGSESRIDTLKDVMRQVLEEAKDINIGLMRFTGGEGGPVLFPIKDIDSDVSKVPGETATYTALISKGENDARENNNTRSVTLDERRIEDLFVEPASLREFESITKSYFVDDSTEDATQIREDGEMTLNDAALTLSYESNIGLMFDNQDRSSTAGASMRIPPNALIEEARLELEFDAASFPNYAAVCPSPGPSPGGLGCYAEYRVRSLLTLDSLIFGRPETQALVLDYTMPDFSDAKFNLYTRDRGVMPGFLTQGEWRFDDNPGAPPASSEREKEAGYDAKSQNIKATIQEIVSHGCTSPVTAATTATAFSDAGCVWSGDKLGLHLYGVSRMAYATDGSFESPERVFESYDKGGANPHPPKLTVTYKQLKMAEKAATIGLRFEDIRIPRGATVESAALIFVPAADEKEAISWTIKAEKTGDSAAFATTNRNLSNRRKTGASATWALPDWQEDEPTESVDLRTVVQEVVNQSAWCGGNALSFLITRAASTNDPDLKRKFFSYEGDPARTVRFQYKYSFDGRGNCSDGATSRRTAAQADDAEQRSSTGKGDVNDRILNLGSNWVGLRFSGLPIPKDAVIERAYLEFYSRSRTSRAVTYTIRGENSGNAAPYATTRRNLTGRSYVPQTVRWSPGGWDRNRRYQSPDIKTIVQQQVRRSDWRAGQALAFLIDKGGRSRSIASYDRNATQAPRLVVEYYSEGKGRKKFKTVRERLEERVEEIVPLGSTPVQATLVEAANYWRGKAVKYGLDRQGTKLTPSTVSNLEPGGALNNITTRQQLDNRYNQTAMISHPGSYCKSESDCDKADTADGKTYGVFNPTDNPADCDPGKSPYTLGCLRQEIKTSGALNYVSPFDPALECGNNFQILMTDGSASTPNRVVVEAQNDIKAIIGAGKTCLPNKPGGGANNADELCSADLAKFLATTDLSGNNKKQSVKTYTIGFALGNASAANHLQQIADEGKGNYYAADTADALYAAFQDILASGANATFAAAPVAANAFNRLFSRDNIYFGSFAPAPGKESYASKRWGGNLKKYRICINPNGPDGDPNTKDDNCPLGAILDAAGNPAVDNNGLFKFGIRSLWSNSNDGREVKQGGAGAEITDYTQRKLYTDINNSGTAAKGASLSGSGFLITNSNWRDSALQEARDTVCDASAPTTAGTPCAELMEWVLGRDVDDEDVDGSKTDTRFVFSDVLHSSPIAVTYGRSVTGTGASRQTTFIDRLLVGTNAGGLHFINGADGKEEWAFLPNELLAKQGTLRTNAALNAAAGERHIYGLDATPVVRVEDKDRDGVIEAGACSGGATTNCGEKVHVYMAMRRGGNSIYALDISDSSSAPKFLWRIDAANNSSPTGGIAKGDFSRMGQTFSEPVLARVNTSAGRKTVLIFGGGYDTRLDNDKPPKSDGTPQPGRNFGLEGGKPNLGNAIYVVDADTGDLIFWIGHDGDNSKGISASGANIKVPGMNYAIASNVNVFDSNGDGVDDRLYVGDTAGNVWRVDLGADIGGSTNPQGSTVVGHFANLSTEGTLADERRIFYRPAVVQVRDTKFSNAERGVYDYVVVGTGNRANPLATGTNDRLYALRDVQTTPMTGSNGIATGYPKDVPTAASTTVPRPTSVALGRPLKESDLVKINANLTAGLDNNTNTGGTAEKAAEGWYLDLKTAGGGNPRPGEKALAPPLVLSGNILFSSYLPDDPSSACGVSVGKGRAYNLGILTGRAGLNWDGSDPKDAKTTKDAVYELKSGGIPPQVVPIYTTEGIKYLVGKETPPGTTENAAVKTYWYLERE